MYLYRSLPAPVVHLLAHTTRFLLHPHRPPWHRVAEQRIALQSLPPDADSITHVHHAGIATPGISTSLSYFDQYRREHLPANLVQAQRDFFGSHTYERNDGQDGWFHTVWSAGQSADSITTSGYKA